MVLTPSWITGFVFRGRTVSSIVSSIHQTVLFLERLRDGIHPMHKPDVLIFGCGYIGFAVAQRLVAAGRTVHAVTRNPARAKCLAAAGIVPHLGDWLDRRSLTDLPQTSQVLVAVGYDRSAGRSQFDVYVEGLRNALTVIDPAAHLVYCSSTGVYHQTGGVWVDETSPCRPGRGGGAAHLYAESLLWRQRPDSPVTILRLAGLYGPGRIPRRKEIVAGEPIPAADQGWLNLIHRDDVASVVLSTWDNPPPRRLYVVSDGHPVLRAHYYRELAKLLCAPPPSFTALDPHSSAAGRAASDKRIDSRRMHQDLLARLAYPDYRAGLRHCIFSGDH